MCNLNYCLFLSGTRQQSFYLQLILEKKRKKKCKKHSIDFSLNRMIEHCEDKIIEMI
jgi:hypothetical protein